MNGLRNQHLVLKKVYLQTFFIATIILYLTGHVAFSQDNQAATPITWFADHKTVYLVDATTHDIVHSLPQSIDITDIAVDPNDRSLWVLSHKWLSKYDKNHQLLFELHINDLGISIPNPHFMRIDSIDSSIWISAGKVLININPQGQLQTTWHSADMIDGLSIDMDGAIRVLAKNQLIRVSKNGIEFQRESLSDKLLHTEFLAYDPLAETLWLANQKELHFIEINSFDPPIPPFLISDPSGVKHIDQDMMNGTLWLATNDYLLGYDRDGQQIAAILLPESYKPVEEISVDSLSHDIWVGTKQVLARFSPSGLLKAEIPVPGELEAITTATAFPIPNLAILEPLDQALTNNAMPTIRYLLSGVCGEFACDPGGVYYEHLSLEITLNGIPISSQFIIDGNHASYTLTVPLSDGENILSAKATDIYGNQSEVVNNVFYVDTTPPNFIRLVPPDGTELSVEQTTITGSVDDTNAVITFENIDILGGTVISSDPSNFSYQIPLSIGSNSFTLIAVDSAGNQQTSTIGLIRTIPLELADLNIEDGMIVSDSQITITGQVTGLPDTTVTINDIPAIINPDGSFTIANIPLNSGENTLTIVVTSPDGQIVTQEITVFVSTAGNWESPVLISEAHEGNNSEPLVGIDKKGNVTVVWTETERLGWFPKARIKTNRYIVGEGWATPQTIVDNLSSRARRYSLTVSENGDVIFIWTECLRNGYCPLGTAHRVYAMHFNSNSGWSTAPVQIDNSALIRTTAIPLVGSDDNGNAIAIFPYQYYYSVNYYNPINGWSLDVDQLPSGSHRYSDLDVSDDGNAIYAWSTGTRLRARRYTPDDGWSPYDELYERSSYEKPSVAIDAQGDSLVVWQGEGDIQLRRHNPNSGWHTPLKLNDDNDAFRRESPQISVNSSPSNEFAVTWEEADRNVRRTIRENEFINGALAGEITVSNHDGYDLERPGHPKIALNDKSDAAIVWVQYDGYKPTGTDITDVWANIRTNNSWGMPIRLEMDDAGPAHSADVVVDNNGIATAVWIQVDKTDWSVRMFASRFDPGQSGNSVPVITPPPDIEMEATAVLTPIDIGQATATDSVDGVLVATPDNTGPFPVGANFVTWSATNSQGVTRTAVQNIIINDTTDPVLTLPTDVEMTVTDASLFPISIDLGIATATDIFTPVEVSNDAPDLFDPGKTIVTWTATDPNGNQITAEQVINVIFDGEMYIRITSPTEGEYIGEGEATVTGVFIGPANAGVLVNGVVAAVKEGKFYVNNIELEPGANVVTATGTTQSGTTIEDSITISADGNSYYVLSLDPNDGVAPFTAEFSIENLSDVNTELVHADYDGDGINDDVKLGEDPTFSHIYTEPGIYNAKFSIQNVFGIVHEKNITVVVKDVTVMDEMFVAIWNDMHDALVAGNLSLASEYLTGMGKRKYVPVFEELLPHMSEIVTTFSGLERVGISNAIGEYAVITNQQGTNYLYLIYFIKGPDGVWKLQSM